MQTKLKSFFAQKEDRASTNGTINSSEIFIIDRKEDKGGDIVVLPIADFDVESVKLQNTGKVKVFYYIFQDFSFKKERLFNGNMLGFEPLVSKDSYHHCECILFPNDLLGNEKWILLVETKYAHDYRAASEKKNDYPHCMVRQIVSTAEYLRRHNIIPPNKMVDAIVSFPKVVINYQSTLFQGDVYRENERELDKSKPVTDNHMSITQIAKKYKIRIKAQNNAIINSETKISFA
ncbi:hypothetical protein [Dysgonomonas sp. 520]|uniref:hypothetical protein n=1 Tax=Dysgonomonas sp. 520 TaxID=2302931 RepID=UPI0013D7BF0A|nr:hypothetical protein [Dysgonomonas sp. 520]NDW11074.1 hypothetical protein [Dysgonomonas sp. 520]